MGVWAPVVVVVVMVMVVLVVMPMIVVFVVKSMASFSVEKVFLQGRVLNLGLGLRFPMVVSVVVPMATTASTGPMVVIVLTSKMVVSLT